MAMQPYFSESFYNPSAGYLAAKNVKATIETSRQQVAEVIGAKANEIIFTAGGTEANNLAIAGIMRNYPKANLVISAIEHPSITEPAKNFKHKVCPVDNQGLIKLADLEKLIDDSTALVSIMYVNNEIGTVEPLKEVASLVNKIKKDRLERGNRLPIYLHSDACQAANYLDLHISRLGVDLMTLNGGKIYGPKQSGALFAKSSAVLKPLIEGGGQERGLRSGTENVAAVVGFAHALQLAQNNRKLSSEKLAKLQGYFVSKLSELPGVTINGTLSKRVVNNVHVTFSGVDNEWLLIKLDNEGIMAAAGSACSASSVEPSSVLRAIGLPGKAAQSSVRFSLGRQTKQADLDYTVNILKKLIG